MISIDQARDLTKRVLNCLGQKYASEDAVDLILGTGIIESRFKYLKQLGSGPASGFFQIEGATAVDNCRNYLKFRPTVVDQCVKATKVPRRYWIKPNLKDWEFLLETNIAAGIVHARIKYWRAPAPMPETTSGKAAYWKRWYNTAEGAGVVEDYIEQVSKYI